MGQAWLQGHESDLLEDKVGQGRVLQCYECVGMRFLSRTMRDEGAARLKSDKARAGGLAGALLNCICVLDASETRTRRSSTVTALKQSARSSQHRIILPIPNANTTSPSP